MTPFELAEPTSLAEAIALMGEGAGIGDNAARAIAGGTALMLMMKAGVFQPKRLVSLRRVEPRYAEIAATPEGGLRIGALATLTALERSAVVKQAAPVITQTLKTLSNVRVRNVATVGGALAHGDPHMDLPPLLTALGAQVRTVSPKGERTLAVGELYTGYYETALAENELITEVLVPPLAGLRVAYKKITTRAADDWPTLGLTVALQLNGGVVADARLVVSAATNTPTRLAAAEKILRGTTLDTATLARCGDAAVSEVELAGDAHGSSAYKRELLRVYTQRVLREIWGKS
ncbi:MAG: xanthine dehydrogenase family protein subunit M [Betaproteobacteria bacterium]|nr:xanthine dehydrogenase family protein subunit M [Betaproteobacteria bacterium]